MKSIKARISKKTGAVTIETVGYEGATCLEATKKLEEGLGIDTSNREAKPEMYQVEQTNDQQVGGA